MFLKGRKGCVWMQGNEQLLEVSGLETAFRIKDDYYNAVDDVSLIPIIPKLLGKFYTTI